MALLDRALLRFLALTPALVVAGCGMGGPAHQPALGNAAEVVDMGFESFNPSVVNVRVGQTVEWRNKSIITHSVTDDPKLAATPGDAGLPAGVEPFSSGDIAAGAIFTHTFLAPGTYAYFCTHHEGAGMVGKIIVSP
jgi:plastocyanin